MTAVHFMRRCPRGDVGARHGLQRLLAASGHQEEAGPALARWAPFAGRVYFHLLLRGLDEHDCWIDGRNKHY